MKRLLNRIKKIGEVVFNEIVDYLSAFACMGTVVDNRVCVTLAVASIFITIIIARKIPWN